MAQLQRERYHRRRSVQPDFHPPKLERGVCIALVAAITVLGFALLVMRGLAS